MTKKDININTFNINSNININMNNININIPIKVFFSLGFTSAPLAKIPPSWPAHQTKKVIIIIQEIRKSNDHHPDPRGAVQSIQMRLGGYFQSHPGAVIR